MAVTNPAFNTTSFLQHIGPLNTPITTTITVTFYPVGGSGLLLYAGNSAQARDFLSLSIFNRRVEFCFDLGSGIAMIVSESISLDMWHTIIASRQYRSGMLVVDGGAPLMGTSMGGTSRLNAAGDIFYGGVLNYSIVSPLAGTEVGFTGCIQSVTVSEYWCGSSVQVMNPLILVCH